MIDVTNHVSSEDSQTPTSTTCEHVPLISKHITSASIREKQRTFDGHQNAADTHDISISMPPNPPRRKQQQINPRKREHFTTVSHRDQFNLTGTDHHSGHMDTVSVSPRKVFQDSRTLPPTHPYDKPLHINTESEVYSSTNYTHLYKKQYPAVGSNAPLHFPGYQISAFPSHSSNVVGQNYECYPERFHTFSGRINDHSRILELDPQRLPEQTEYNHYKHRQIYDHSDINTTKECKNDLPGNRHDRYFGNDNVNTDNGNVNSIPPSYINDYNGGGHRDPYQNYRINYQNSHPTPFPQKEPKCFINITLL